MATPLLGKTLSFGLFLLGTFSALGQDASTCPKRLSKQAAAQISRSVHADRRERAGELLLDDDEVALYQKEGALVILNPNWGLLYLYREAVAGNYADLTAQVRDRTTLLHQLGRDLVRAKTHCRTLQWEGRVALLAGGLACLLPLALPIPEGAVTSSPYYYLTAITGSALLRLLFGHWRRSRERIAERVREDIGSYQSEVIGQIQTLLESYTKKLDRYPTIFIRVPEYATAPTEEWLIQSGFDPISVEEKD